MSSSLVLCNSNEPFLYWTVTCNKKWILHDNRRWPVQWLDQEEASKHFPKPNLHQKNSHGHCCLMVRCQSGSLSEFQQNHYIWDACSANQWDRPKTAKPAASTGQQKGPNSSPQQCLTTCRTQALNELSYEICLFRHIHLTFHQPTTTFSSFLKTFCRENTSTTSRMLKMLSKCSLNPETWIFMLQE